MEPTCEQGLLVVISGPSGVGKTTIVHRVRDAFDAVFSISATTRPQSKSEIDGKDYYFITPDQFSEKGKHKTKSFTISNPVTKTLLG